MKKTPFLLLLLALLLALSACAPAADAAPVSPTSVAGEYLNTEYADATSLRNQLAFGTLQLEDTENAVTSEQAQKLIPFWQAIITLSGDTTTADEELIAVQDQIVQTLTDEQLQTIADMKLTTADLDAFYAEHGIVFPTPVPGVTKVPGSGSSMSAEDKAATQTAAEAAGIVPGTGSSAGKAAKTLLFEKVIELLQSK